MSREELLIMRFHLSWLPLFGAGLQMRWGETLDLPMDEAEQLGELISDRRQKEWRTAFKKRRG